jgi:hypothetical protein
MIVVVPLLVDGTSSHRQGSRTDFENVEALLLRMRRFEPPPPGAAALPTSLNGYQFHWIAYAGAGTRFVVVSRMMGGALLLFDRRGTLVANRETGEITWMALCDLGQDGVSELLLEQIVGQGTGVLAKTYFLYGLAGGRIRELWRGTSIERTVPPYAPDRLVRGYVQCDTERVPPMPQLRYMKEITENGKRTSLEKQAFTLVDGNLKEVPWVEY